MKSPTDKPRILIVDDNERIHRDFEKILGKQESSNELGRLHAALFDEQIQTTPQVDFDLAFAFQGQEALAKVVQAKSSPFALAFVDMRMPPGWDGLATIQRLWDVDPNIQIVICSAFSDYSWSDIRRALGDRDSLLVIKKPFDPIEVVQCAHALTTKWRLERESRRHVEELEAVVRERTEELSRKNAHLVAEIEQRNRIEEELRLAQRLEAIGQLAAGIAHEISTPIQYVGDHALFLRECFETVLATVREARATLSPEERQRLDLDFALDQIPESLGALEHGVERITRIVRGMREFAHPGPREAIAADINRAVSSTLEVTAGKYRAVADLDVDLGALPPVTCDLGELNQVFLNLIVNATHAMESVRRERRGKLGVRTRVDGDHVIISIADNGAGIPDTLRERVFDAFFTTKEIGRGTGQGLSIAHSIVVDRHGGTLRFDSVVGQGTTFHVRIPIAGRDHVERAAEPRTRSATAAGLAASIA